ncbi:MAG: nucleoside hydrolase [Firmicutes bacterium]|nr:nucleoside hydrolase [Bacillota bacterium]
MKWIIDTDPGIDDAAAIIASVRSGLDVTGISVVYGNASLEHTLKNALRLIELLDVRIPVYPGVDRPLLGQLHRAAVAHGEDGFGDNFLPAPNRREEGGHAIDFLLESARRFAGNLSLLVIGPLTNVALAIARDRCFCDSVSQIVIMGGTSGARGNATMVSEFNIYADPEAAAIVLGSGIPITMVPLETARKVLLGVEFLEMLERSKAPLAQFFSSICGPVVRRVERQRGARGLVLCDLVAAALAIEPGLARSAVQSYVAVETGGSVSRGLTAVDYSGISGCKPNATVCLDVDAARVGDIFAQALTT